MRSKILRAAWLAADNGQHDTARQLFAQAGLDYDRIREQNDRSDDVGPDPDYHTAEQNGVGRY